MYHKGHRESVDCMDDIVLIQTSDVENDSAIQDVKVKILFQLKFFFFFRNNSFLQTTCKIKHLIEYQYDEEKDIFYDLTTQLTSPLSLLETSLKLILNETANNMR